MTVATTSVTMRTALGSTIGFPKLVACAKIADAPALKITITATIIIVIATATLTTAPTGNSSIPATSARIQTTTETA